MSRDRIEMGCKHTLNVGRGMPKKELRRVLSDVLAACGRLRESTEAMGCLR